MAGKKKAEIKLSATRISTFLQCKQKYWFNYVDKMPKLPNPVFRLGLAVHDALEYAGEIWLEKEDREKFTKKEIEKILDKYNEFSVREGIEDISTHDEGKDLVTKRLKNFIAGKKLLALEQKFGFEKEFKIGGIPILGAIDKAEEVDEDTLLIVDYKTSKTVPDAEHLRSDIQLSIYDLVAKKLWPDYNRTVLSLDILRQEMVYTYRTDEERAEFVKYLKEIYKQMKSLKKKDVAPQMNMFCPWCDFRDHCEAYQDSCHKTDYKFNPVARMKTDELIEEWQKIRNTKKLLAIREKELGMIMMEKIKANTANNLTGKEEEVYIRQNARKAYDLSTVYEFVPRDHFHRLVNINKKAVDKYIDDNPAVKNKLLDSMVVNYTSPFLAIKKIKK